MDMAPSKPSISKVETERTMEGPYGHKSGHTESPKDNEETPNQSQVDSRAPELEAACPDSPENPNPGYSHSLEPDACQNPIKFFKTVSALEAEQPRFASNSSSVSLPLKRISQEDWSGSGVNGSSEDNKLVIPSLSTRKIRQILVASRRSNSSHQVHDNASMVLRQHGRYSQTPSVRSVDSVSGTFVSVQSCGPLIEGGGGGKSVQFDQDYSNLTLDECNSCVSSLDSRHPKSHQKSGSLASSSAGGHPPGRQTRGLDMCYSQQYISQGQCHMDILKEEIHLMEQLEQGVLLFNNSPEEGISYMIEHELVEDDPLYIANFILHTDFLDKRKVGELLGGHSNLSLSILNNYVHLFNTSSLEPDVALRYFLSRFFLPGESQMVYRILERFSVSYVRDNPTTLYTSDQIHTLCYALVMLNTSLHNSHVRTKMSKQEFISMCIHSNLPITNTQLETMYDRVAENELKPLLSPSEKVYGRLSRDPKVLRSKQVSQVSSTLLQKGTVFRRFCKKNSSHTIIAWISSDSRFFCWKKVRSKSSHLLNPGSFVNSMSPHLKKLVSYNKKRLSKPRKGTASSSCGGKNRGSGSGSGPGQKDETSPESHSCILTNHSRIANKIRRALGMDISDLSCILLDDIVDINVGVSSKIRLDRKSSKILRRGAANSAFSCRSSTTHLQSELESRCFSLTTRSGESISLCSLDSTSPSLLVWVRFFHQTILKNQETREANETAEGSVMTVYGIPNLDKGIESDLLRVWHHGIFIQWENHWSMNSLINLCNSELPNALSFSNKELLSSGSSNTFGLLDPKPGPSSAGHLLQEAGLARKAKPGPNTDGLGPSSKSPSKDKSTWSQKRQLRRKALILYPEPASRLRSRLGLLCLRRPKYAPPSHNLHNKYISYQAPTSHLIIHLWINNIPCSCRGTLWNIAVGNKLQIQGSTFTHLLRLRNNFLGDVSDLQSPSECGEMHACAKGGPQQEVFLIHMKRFHKDICNVFPELHSLFVGAGAVLGYRIWEWMKLRQRPKSSNEKRLSSKQSDSSSFTQTLPPCGGQSLESNLSQKILDNEEDSELESVFMFFSDNPSIHRIDQSTKILVECFILYRPDIGYVEGMSHIAMILLLFNIDLMEAFKTFTNLLHSSFFLDMFMLNRRNIKMRLDFFDMLFKELMPSLAHHFDLLSITSDTYLISWFTSLFSTCLPLQVIPKVWDSLFLFGEPYAFQVAVAVLKYHEHKLIMTSFEGCISILHSIPPVFDFKRFSRALEHLNGNISHRFGLWLAAQRLSEQKTDLMEELL